jgi:NAD(P)-dependent dehydrogenase (short-subunit alcohol dehydrogenase family)
VTEQIQGVPRTVVITGASSGIGRAAAAELARSDFLVFAAVRKPADGDKLRAELGEGLVPLVMDVTDQAAIAAAAALVGERVGESGLDGLVNNAGIGTTAPVEYVPLEVLRHEFEVNVFGQIAVTQAFLPLIRKARGRIVNTGSVGSHLTIPFGGLLCASKYALHSLNDALRMELHPFGIRVVLIEPSAIVTAAVEKTLGDVEETIRAMPPEGAARYADMLRAFTRRAYDREIHGSRPEVVAHAILHALTARRPRTRYPVGEHAGMMVRAPRLLPDRLLDRIRFRLFGMPTRFGVAVLPAPAR